MQYCESLIFFSTIVSKGDWSLGQHSPLVILNFEVLFVWAFVPKMVTSFLIYSQHACNQHVWQVLLLFKVLSVSINRYF